MLTHRRSHIGAIAAAAGILAASEPLIGKPKAAVSRTFPSWKHDSGRLAAAEEKRARKKAKRLRDMRGY
jgi:hypothetical protein